MDVKINSKTKKATIKATKPEQKRLHAASEFLDAISQVKSDLQQPALDGIKAIDKVLELLQAPQVDEDPAQKKLPLAEGPKDTAAVAK